MADSLLPFVVYETGLSYESDGVEEMMAGPVEIRERESGEVIATHDTLRAALDDLLDEDGYKPRAPLLRIDGEPAGAWRWHDMTAVEDEPAEDGSQVTALGISRMAARLNASSPIMIDGGSGDSDAHASLSKSDTPANGWTHVGVEVVDPGGRLHLWGYSEVLPDIAKAMDSNRLAYGSIGFGTKAEDNDDARLYQHALTNIPAVAGLHPAGTPRAMHGIHFRTRRIDGRGEQTMSDPKPARRALEAFESPEAQDAWTERLLAAMGKLFPDAAPDAALDLFEASSEAFAAALEKPAEEPEEPEAEPEERAEPDPEEEDLDAERAATALGVERAKREKAEAERDALLAERAEREAREFVVAELDKRGLKPDEAAVRGLVNAAKRSRDEALAFIGMSHQPPSGDVFSRGAPADAAPKSLAEAIDSLTEEVAKAHPGEQPHLTHARARKLAVKRWPQLAASSTQPDPAL